MGQALWRTTRCPTAPGTGQNGAQKGKDKSKWGGEREGCLGRERIDGETNEKLIKTCKKNKAVVDGTGNRERNRPRTHRKRTGEAKKGDRMQAKELMKVLVLINVNEGGKLGNCAGGIGSTSQLGKGREALRGWAGGKDPWKRDWDEQINVNGKKSARPDVTAGQPPRWAEKEVGRTAR